MDFVKSVGIRSARAWKLGVGSLLMASAFAASAQTGYPTKPIRLVIAFGAGGIADVVMRVYSQKLGEELKQSIIVENKPGASGIIAAQYVAQAAPDGYTVFIGSVGTQVINKLIYNKLPYDPDAFVPVSMLTSAPFLMAVNKTTGIENVDGLVAQARKDPTKLNFGSAGNGTSPHLSVELLKFSTNTSIMHVPFKSGADAVNATMGGQVDLVADGIPVVSSGIASGKLRPIALLASKRNPAVPDVPTGAEQGYPDLQVASWSVLLAPPGTPKDVVDALEAAIARTSSRQDVKDRFTEMGVDLTPTGKAAYKKFLAAETDKWGKVVKAANIRLD